ncbi:hypothetical protein [Eleftheria terrae]|uniref:hypothetical protein n=1 Tax=Eleftheria terrae TaxID=1597781 RepID=UPI00263AF22B|nr:hypothetical protein [Eleftheria terrae]WKB55631.1 hypothetical protein N7L95_26525 [Eleftheria terrae]
MQHPTYEIELTRSELRIGGKALPIQRIGEITTHTWKERTRIVDVDGQAWTDPVPRRRMQGHEPDPPGDWRTPVTEKPGRSSQPMRRRTGHRPIAWTAGAGRSVFCDRPALAKGDAGPLALRAFATSRPAKPRSWRCSGCACHPLPFWLLAAPLVHCRQA